ncbi:MAG TPA: hypothetical protein VIL94_06125, partial [Acidothermaceae bacterium]
MAPAKRSGPGRALAAVFVLVAVLFGGMALGGRYSPELGLDLQGGTTVTLTPTATAGTKITAADLETAKNILSNRVNSLGVSNATVQREGSNVVISVPGKNTQGVLDNVGKTALLSIRQVYQSNNPSMTGAVVTAPTVTPSVSPSASVGAATPGATPSATPSAASPSATPSAASPSATPAPTSPKALGRGGTTHVQDAGFVRAATSAPASSSAAPSATASASAASASAAPGSAA